MGDAAQNLLDRHRRQQREVREDLARTPWQSPFAAETGTGQGQEDRVVKIVTNGDPLSVLEQSWSGSAFSDVGTAFPAEPHPEVDSGDYVVGDRYIATLIGETWWVHPLTVANPVEGFTGTVTVVIDLTFDVAGCLISWETQNLTYEDGLLKTVTA